MLEKKRLYADTINYFLENSITMKPKIVTKDEFKIVGLKCSTTLKDNAENRTIPKLWQGFIPRMSEVKNAVNPKESYGICLNDSTFDLKEFSDEEEYEYLAGLEVPDFDNMPEGMITRVIPKQKYAVFTHKGSLDKLSKTYDYIYGTWAAKGEEKIADADDFELYDERFDAQNPENSEMDIYVPIK
jgi:AraC family transcriptional regulator